jgi:hypothetical protein
MEKEQHMIESESIITPSITLQSTQKVEKKPAWQIAKSAEPNCELLSEELVFEIIERIKSL